jgi:hypothetical protein
MMAAKSSSKKEAPLVAELMSIRCHPNLRQRVIEDAKAKNPRLTLSEIVVRILAAHYGDPELAIIPKKPMGRPPKEHAQVA